MFVPDRQGAIGNWRAERKKMNWLAVELLNP